MKRYKVTFNKDFSGSDRNFVGGQTYSLLLTPDRVRYYKDNSAKVVEVDKQAKLKPDSPTHKAISTGPSEKRLAK